MATKKKAKKKKH